jgi:competence protein ComFC
MAIVEIHPIQIFGRWRSGVALDLHTTSSTPTGHNEFGHMQFETVRPEIAELLYLLKNRSDRGAAEPIIETVADFLAAHGKKFDIIIPVEVKAVEGEPERPSASVPNTSNSALTP